MYYFLKFVVLLIAISILFFGCTSTNAIYSDRNPKNEIDKSKNDVVEYKEPQYKRRKNVIFLGTVLAGGVGGALAGYLNPKEENTGKGEFREVSPGVKQWYPEIEKNYTTNTLIGAGAGLIVTYYLAKWLTPNSGAYQISANQEQKWLDDINEEMRLNSIIVNKYKNSSDTIANMFLIPKSSENNFKMDNLNDAFLYTSAFPNSKYTGNLLTNSFHNFHREELPKLIDYFKSDPSTEKVKLHYLNTGSGFNDYINAYKRYPLLKNEAENKASASASSIDEYKYYLANFPNGASAPQIRQKLEKAEFTENVDWGNIVCYPEKIRSLIKQGIDLNAPDKTLKIPPLYISCGRSYYEKEGCKQIETAKLLLRNGANVNYKTSGGSTALMYASGQKYWEMIELLLKNGAKVNVKTNNGTFALYAAVSAHIWQKGGNYKVIKLLLKYGADVNLVNSRTGNNAIELAEKNGEHGLVDLLKNYK